jgi:hypothetical protein
MDDAKPSAQAARMCPTDGGRMFGDYRICKGLYSQHPLAHERDLKKFGPLFVVVFEGKIIAFIRRELAWVHSEHRGKGIGPEMGADIVQASGGPEIYYSKGGIDKRTVGGKKLAIAVNKILAARGVK